MQLQTSCILAFDCYLWSSLTRQRICPEMHALAKMAEMAINPQNRQTVDKNTNEMAKGPFGKWRFWGKWRISLKSPVSKGPLLASNSNGQRLAIFSHFFAIVCISGHKSGQTVLFFRGEVGVKWACSFWDSLASIISLTVLLGLFSLHSGSIIFGNLW